MSAQAIPESEVVETGNTENVVFWLSDNAVLSDTKSVAAAHRRHCADFLLLNPESTVTLFAVSNKAATDFTDTKTGIYVKAGGVYVYEAIADGSDIISNEICIAEEGTLSEGEWYSVESDQRVVEDNVVYAGAKIYNAAGELVVNGAMRRVGMDFSLVNGASVTADKCVQSQIAGTNVLVDNWNYVIIDDTTYGTIVVDDVEFDSENNATVTLSNTDREGREYLIVVARLNGNGKYLETAAAYGVLDAGTDEQVIAGPILSEKNPGETIRVMVWDNWDTMSFFGDAVETVVE